MNISTKLAGSLTLALATGLVAGPVAAQDGCGAPSGPADPAAVTGGNAALSALQPGPAPATAPRHCWTGASGDAVVVGRVVALGDIVATLSDQNEVVAYPADGAEVWRVPINDPNDGHLGGLTTDGQRVYVAAADGVLALDPADGSEIWRNRVETALVAGSTGATSPIVVGDTVYAVLSTTGQDQPIDRAVVAYDAASGDERWSFTLFPELPAGPVAADESLVVVWDGAGNVFAIDPASGTEIWRTGIEELGIVPIGPISIKDGLVVTSLAGGEVVVLSADDGSKLWGVVPESQLTASITLQDGTLFVNGVTQIFAYDSGSGEQLWAATLQERESPFPYRPVPAVVDGLVIVGTTDVNANASLVAFDAASGAEVWRTTTEIFGALLSPVVTGGRVYATAVDVNQEGGLFAFGAAGS